MDPATEPETLPNTAQPQPQPPANYAAVGRMLSTANRVLQNGPYACLPAFIPPEVYSFVILPPATQRAIREKHARGKRRLEPDEPPILLLLPRHLLQSRWKNPTPAPTSLSNPLQPPSPPPPPYPSILYPSLPSPHHSSQRYLLPRPHPRHPPPHHLDPAPPATPRSPTQWAVEEGWVCEAVPGLALGDGTEIRGVRRRSWGLGGSIGGGFLGRRGVWPRVEWFVVGGVRGVVGGRFAVLRGGGRLGAGDRLEFIHTEVAAKSNRTRRGPCLSHMTGVWR